MGRVYHFEASMQGFLLQSNHQSILLSMSCHVISSHLSPLIGKKEVLAVQQRAKSFRPRLLSNISITRIIVVLVARPRYSVSYHLTSELGSIRADHRAARCRLTEIPSPFSSSSHLPKFACLLLFYSFTLLELEWRDCYLLTGTLPHPFRIKIYNLQILADADPLDILARID